LPAGNEHHSTPSIGIALFDDASETVDDLLRHADLAMYQAKTAGRNTLRFFEPQMQAAIMARAALETGLRTALAEAQFVLHYQAQVDSDGALTGVEALVRWQHPQSGLIAPGQFIALAEETGLIVQLGEWVLRSACAQLARWASDPRMAHATLAVNVSARQIRDPRFVDQVVAALDAAGAAPRLLKLELTESQLVDNVESVIATMDRLQAQGVGFSLDDFGTGYSSLSYLKRLPLDQLKIDQSFVRDILSDPNDAAIARMIVVLAETLNLTVVAEGVENAAQRDALAMLGCQVYQGYFFSRPVPIDAFTDYVRGLPAPAQA
jgi:EAL domain-containing protein (putative c-di-GMP-specific phosphodiesterase class I)